jgi:hypothetical protein
LGKRLTDKLVKVVQRSGRETWVLIHIEIQSQEDGEFSERMFVYYYRLRDKYDREIASLAILGDDRETWRPGPFETDLWGCRARFEFPTIKLLDYESRWSELEASRNPFAIAVMAHLKTKATRQDFPSRKEWKFRLTRQLYEQGYERQDILNLFKFLDWIMELPQDLKQAFRTELEQYEQERQMPYITSIEQMAKEESRVEMAVKMLQEKISVEVIVRVTGLSPEALRQLQVSQGT